MTTVSESKVQCYERIEPTQTNSFGNAHGGELVKLMDEIAAISAMRVANKPCVTAKISEVNFNTPIDEGDIIELNAFVYETGETSLEVCVTVAHEEVSSDRTNYTTTARFTFVAVDENGNPTPTEKVKIESEPDRNLREQALN